MFKQQIKFYVHCQLAWLNR